MDGYTIPEAASLTGLTPKEVRLAIEEGRLRAFDVGGRRRIPREDIECGALLEPPPEPTAAGAAPSSPDSGQLEELRDRLDEIERRVADLERHEERPGRAAMRPALEPLFAPPRYRFDGPN
jgi:excisionase family DNA binding protein